MFSIIVAIGKNLEIGQNNKLLCHLPDDLKYFKQITSNHTVLMGQNTYLSLPIRPLPNRRNIILSFNKSDKYEGCEMAYSMDDVFKLCSDEEEVFVIGGATIYRQFFPLCDKLYLTHMNAEFPKADVFFPEIDYNKWDLVEEKFHPSDEIHIYDFCYKIYIKKFKKIIC